MKDQKWNLFEVMILKDRIKVRIEMSYAEKSVRRATAEVGSTLRAH